MKGKGMGIIILVIAGIAAAFYFLKGKIKRRAVNEEVYVERRGIVKTVKSPQIKEVKKKEVVEAKKVAVFTTAMMRSLPKSERPWRKAGMTERAWHKQQRKWKEEAGIVPYISPAKAAKHARWAEKLR